MGSMNDQKCNSKLRFIYICAKYRYIYKKKQLLFAAHLDKKKLNILLCIEIFLKALLLLLKKVKRILMSFLTSFGSSTGKLL